MKRLISAGILLSALPGIAFAATSVTNSNLFDITANVLLPLIQSIIPILTSFALLGFFWGVARYVWIAKDEKKRAEGKNVMIWGIVAFFLFLSITGIVNLLQSTFSIGGNQVLTPPCACAPSDSSCKCTAQ